VIEAPFPLPRPEAKQDPLASLREMFPKRLNLALSREGAKTGPTLRSQQCGVANPAFLRRSLGVLASLREIFPKG
jgi:hypothetical protein